MGKIRVGTRGSKLALRQAAMVQEALRRVDSRIETEIVVIHTKGDKILDKPLADIGDKGVFVSELEQALFAGRIDIAVHSAKDLPMELARGLCIAAVLPRGDVRDVLVVPKEGRLPYPGQGDGRTFVVGSGSRRRQAQAVQMWDNVVCKDIRGNVDTRLRKLKDGGYDGIILAKAGLDRLGIGLEEEDEFMFLPLPPGQFVPAACQGIIVAEAVRDSSVVALCRQMTDEKTEQCFLVERELLARLSADCSESAGAWCRQEEGHLVLDAMYAENRQRLTCKAETEAGLEMAERIAKSLRDAQHASMRFHLQDETE